MSGFKVNVGKTAPAAVAAAAQNEAAPAPEAQNEAAPATPPTAAFKAQPSWMKTGAAADDAFAEQSASKADFGIALDKRKALPYEFWMRPGEEKRITFLDGYLATDPAEQGRLIYNAFRFHTVRNLKFPTKFDSYVCLGEEPGGCPLCEGGDESTWVSVFPIIDHSAFTNQQGVTRQHEVKLFIAKSITIKLLQKKAAKYGGLAYQCFDFSRTDSKMARVGDQMDYVGPAPLEAMQAKFPEHNLPLDADWYLKSVPYFTRDEIMSMGYGAGTQQAPAGSPPSLGGGQPPPPANDNAIGAGVPEDDNLPF